jgi:hypothetical protein
MDDADENQQPHRCDRADGQRGLSVMVAHG